ncbi:uncharacterized protein CDAR_439741 [Caerostris darwini]|uniref:Uncharacterized protein n=1 Tax=Caerostris darwini TaxID=1538125 RepID=A0AAV4RW78_9ARAC|nr:uncharacterized protein CDAR_439741 [Caerostris darwini]
MSAIFFFTALFLLAAADTNEGEAQRSDRIESEDTRGDTVAYESYGSPVYGVSDKSGGLPPPGKSAYTAPPPLPAMAAGYAGYLNNLGFVNPYASFNRFGMMPYAAPYGFGAAPYGFGAAYGAFPYGLGAPMAAGLGYPAGLPYGAPFMGRSAYTALGYPGFNGLGYRFGGVGPAGLRGPVPLAGPVPAPVPGPAPVAAQAAVARAPVAAVGKDGTLRYGYGPVPGQRPPVY